MIGFFRLNCRVLMGSEKKYTLTTFFWKNLHFSPQRMSNQVGRVSQQKCVLDIKGEAGLLIERLPSGRFKQGAMPPDKRGDQLTGFSFFKFNNRFGGNNTQIYANSRIQWSFTIELSLAPMLLQFAPMGSSMHVGHGGQMR